MNVIVVALAAVLLFADAAPAQTSANTPAATGLLTQADATLIAAGIAAAAAICSAALSYFSIQRQSRENRKTQLEVAKANADTQTILKSIDARQRTVELLRNEDLRPFIAELLRNAGLAANVLSHARKLQSNLLSPAFKRELLSNSQIVFDWGDSMVALGNQRSRVLLGLSAGSLNELITILNDLYKPTFPI